MRSTSKMSSRTYVALMCASGVIGALLLFSAPTATVTAAARAQSQDAPGQQVAGDLSTLVSSGNVETGFGTLEPKTEVRAEDLTLEEIQQRTAAIRAQQAGRLVDRQLAVPVPQGAAARLTVDSAPTEAAEPATQANAATPTGPEAAATLPNAPNDMAIFFQHDISAAEVATSQRSTVMEPTTVNLDQGVFYTANWFAAKSTNGGSSFSYISPYTFFPSVNGGFCCDQWTAYAPAQDMAIWYLQYVKDANTNTGRLARTIGSAGIGANAWVYWDFTPQGLGFGAGVWLDYPSMTVAGNSLYITSNAFTTAANAFVGSTVIRLSLAELAAGGTLNYQFFTTTLGTQRLTEGAGSTMYWLGFTTTTQMRIHRWAEGSGTIFWDDVNLDAFNYLNRDGIATSPDGTNWALRADSRPTAAYVANGIIGAMWTAKQGTGRPKPYTVHARFSEATRALVTQADIWNADYAWMYPSASPNPAGNLAGTLQIGGAPSGTFAYPGTQIWITDDVTGASSTIGAAHFVSASNAGPTNNAWGDYFSVRRHKVATNTWVGASHTLQGGGAGTNAVPKYFWFGRERDGVRERASITSPVPNSVLPLPNVTFNWTTGTNALQYWLYVGTTGVGSANVWNQDQGTALSRAVTGIPTGIIYVRLWTRFATTGWEFNDYTYYRAAEITSPTPGSHLPGSSTTFSWTNATGAAQYWLYVGSTGIGSANIWNQDQGTATSRLVTGIPTVVGTIYVRLWTRFDSIGWVFKDYSYTAGTTKAVITSPAPGTTLPGSSPTFIWTPGAGALRYWLYVGSAGVGSANLWNQDQGTATSRVVTGLPLTGATIYVRLWTLFASGWEFNDYTYTAAQKAVITSPAPGTTLPGGAATFAWTTGAGASQYWLYVGTTGVGSANLWNQAQGTATSRIVTGLPVSGETIYLRLWTLFASGWEFNDYTYTGASSVRARLISPTPGSVLPGSSATFSWSPGTGSSAYWVYVGSAMGGTDIANEGLGIAPAVMITGIPIDGRRIYVRLWSLTSLGWFFTDYSFTAAGTPRARLATPAEDSVLGGPSSAFTWSAGSAATQYWIYVGNSPGAADLLSQNMGTALNVTVAGLPTDRRPIYVRLWSLVTGVWVYNDYVFRAFDGGGTRGRIWSPEEDVTLAGTTTTFNWTAGSGAAQYWLYVGTTRGGANLWNLNMGTALSSVVTGLPTDGTPVYVRLWSLVGGVWVYNEYDYKAAP